MPTLTVYPDATPGTDTVDGIVVDSIDNATWSDLVTSTFSFPDDTSAVGQCIWIGSFFNPDTWSILGRSIYLFKTSSLGSGATISSAILSLYGQSKADNLNITPDIDIYTSNPASNTVLASEDFASFDIISQTGSPITYANLSIVGYNDFTFNVTGISNINKTGISKFGARNASYDVANEAPTWSFSESSYLNIDFADNGSNQPKLVITYTTGGISVGWLGA